MNRLREIFKKDKPQTNARVITWIFMRVFLVLTVLNIFVISAVVAFSGLQMREAEGSSLLSSVQEAANDGNINWREFELAGDDGQWADYVRVTRANGDIDMSHGTADFLKSNWRFHLDYFHLTNNGIFWHDSTTSDGITAELWLNIDAVVESVARTVAAIILVMLALFVVSIFMIRRTSRRLSEPLENLAEAANLAEDKSLPVPENPQEVHQLALNFNQLLGRLNLKIEQEQQFVSDASHELRTPVAAIRGHVTLLKRRWKEHPEIIEDSLNYIDEESLRMKKLIEDLLMISRGNRMKTEKEEIDLAIVAEKITEDIKLALPQKVSFELSNHEDNKTEAFLIHADRAAIQHIIIAFLENAGKYAPKDTKITVKLKKVGDSIDLSVADEGTGIPDDEKAQIFERFYRIDKSRSSEIPGTGLGLAIAKQYAEANGAWIFVSDNLPCGSIFHLVFSN
ncbi:ATP-binding protein [Lactococcus nasutitermitis]|uniref:histidine kinase n=1 Tax=Lactococcus nasutitermitis TaxID=1652957 RepID=A0ABV9JAJ2_9LACT|nr:HAMP domain-containing sensor histidine kinase [Lactococcus nasutitermitis]